jgi:LysM repeat protein
MNMIRPLSAPWKKGRLWWPLAMIVILALPACHFPRAAATPSEEPALAQRLTEAAALQTPTPYQPPASPMATSPALKTPTLGLPPQPTPEPPVEAGDGILRYTVQPGDTLPALALRFGVSLGEIQAEVLLSTEGYLPAGETVRIPDAVVSPLPYTTPLLPDAEVIYGPSLGSFDAAAFARAAGGFLATYAEPVGTGRLTGPEIVQLVAVETSTNPRLLLAFLEYRSGWVFDHPAGAAHDPYPIGYGAGADTGLYKELMITAKILAQGYYGWRNGSQLSIAFRDGETGRLHPGLNAGSAALLRLFAVLHNRKTLEVRLFSAPTFLDFYQSMFGDYWARDSQMPLAFPADSRQPRLYLPFTAGAPWSLTAGPHLTWQTGTPRGALDFAPVTGEAPCAVSVRWVTAAAPGLVVRSDRGAVALDLDGDGDEGTGWVLVYLHIASADRVEAGIWLNLDDRIGHPSCEGGRASGTHVHLARKFNGEWLAAQGPIPLVLSGWEAFPGEGRYEGYLKQGDEIITARPDGSHGSTITRED